jgi:hypothetical protein
MMMMMMLLIIIIIIVVVIVIDFRANSPCERISRVIGRG